MLNRIRHSLTARTLLGSTVPATILVVACTVLVIAVGNLRSAQRVALRAQQSVTPVISEPASTPSSLVGAGGLPT